MSNLLFLLLSNSLVLILREYFQSIPFYNVSDVALITMSLASTFHMKVSNILKFRGG